MKLKHLVFSFFIFLASSANCQNEITEIIYSTTGTKTNPETKLQSGSIQLTDIGIQLTDKGILINNKCGNKLIAAAKDIVYDTANNQVIAHFATIKKLDDMVFVNSNQIKLKLTSLLMPSDTLFLDIYLKVSLTVNDINNYKNAYQKYKSEVTSKVNGLDSPVQPKLDVKATEQVVENLEKEVQKLNEELKILKDKAASLTVDKMSVSGQLNKTETEIEKFKTELKLMNEESDNTLKLYNGIQPAQPTTNNNVIEDAQLQRYIQEAKDKSNELNTKQLELSSIEAKINDAENLKRKDEANLKEATDSINKLNGALSVCKANTCKARNDHEILTKENKDGVKTTIEPVKSIQSDKDSIDQNKEYEKKNLKTEVTQIFEDMDSTFKFVTGYIANAIKFFNNDSKEALNYLMSLKPNTSSNNYNLYDKLFTASGMNICNSVKRELKKARKKLKAMKAMTNAAPPIIQNPTSLNQLNSIPSA